jgi:preprotein translocase subunit SecE
MESKSVIEKVKGWPAGLKDYFQELHMEMRRVTWPNRKQVRATTLVVIATVFAFAAYFFVVDFALTRTIGKVLDMFSKI